MTIFTEVTLLVATAALMAFLMKLLRQPLVIGYILTGLLVGPLFLNLIQSEETLALFSEIGIAFLLFIVGLNLTPQTVKTFGKVALVTGLGQVIFTFAVGWALALALGFSATASAYLAIALAFSSTIIILKLLSDKGDLDKLYGKISIGFLLVQDFVAVLILFLVPLFAGPETSSANLVLTIAKGLGALFLVYLLAHYAFPKFNIFLARSQELLFLFAIAWGLGLAAGFRYFGFSLESGALIAGATLSILPSHDEIHARLKPLRDFFIILFFILLGAKMAVSGLGSFVLPAVILSLFVLIGNPFILMLIMGLLGYRKKTSFQTGLTVAQISEFSLIVVAMGVKFGHVSSEVLSLATMVGLITIFVSTYFVLYSERLYEWLSPALSVFERRGVREKVFRKAKPNVILFGLNRIGFDFLNVFRASRDKFLVIDYDPEVVEDLQRRKIPNEYGDAGDLEFLRLCDFRRVKLAVSTIPEYRTNYTILQEVRHQNKKAVVMAVAHNIADATALYEAGMDYVILPHFLGGRYASLLVKHYRGSKRQFEILKRRHLEYLRRRAAFGHEHPVREALR